MGMGGQELMHEVRKGIWLGSLEAETGPFRVLQSQGITHVLQLGTSSFMQPTHKNNLEYCCIEALDSEGEDLLEKLQRAKAHDFIDNCLQGGGGVLVHCYAGISRSTTAVVSYIMSKDGIGFEDALQEVMRKRPSVAPNRGFCKQLRFLQEESNGQLANYRPEMLQTAPDLSWKQWLGLLTRVRERARPVRNSNDEGSDPGSPLPLNSTRKS